MKIDVAIQSYKKPELLLYTLLSLYKHSSEHIDTIYINDDSGEDSERIVKIYQSEQFLQLFRDWKIKVRKNIRRTGWWQALVKDQMPKYISPFYFIYRASICLLKTGHIFTNRHDIRYQWAFDFTNKKYVYVLHDDVIFNKDIVGLYIYEAEKMKNPGIIGDLGQCWRCPHSNGNSACSPEKIMNGYRPSRNWPKTSNAYNGSRRACRINEWSALIAVEAIKYIEQKEHVFFGNYDDFGDVGAYWFDMCIKNNFDFLDPLPTIEQRRSYYTHGWRGVSGHSIWVNQGSGKNEYNRNEIINAIYNDFGINFNNLVSK